MPLGKLQNGRLNTLVFGHELGKQISVGISIDRASHVDIFGEDPFSDALNWHQAADQAYAAQWSHDYLNSS